jgi:ketosteroid isomerase-like protein
MTEYKESARNRAGVSGGTAEGRVAGKYPLSPHEAVEQWWQAMQDADIDALGLLALHDYISAGGPEGRELGRDAFLAGAERFFAAARIDGWELTDVKVRRHGDTAICSYVWTERGSHDGRDFDMRGVATDVLVCDDGRWRHQAHHVSVLPEGPAHAPWR